MNSGVSNNLNLEKLLLKSKNIRKKILQMAMEAGSSSAHIGGALSIADILSILFFHVMTIDKNDPLSDKRDRFILSKGHACLALYAILYEKGLINKEHIETFEQSGSDLLGHPVKNRKIGIDFSTGSLGMGLSLATGVAISLKKKSIDRKVYVVIGDGECNEGSIWESAMLVPNLKLNNLVTIIDNNNFQQTGSLDEILSNKNLAEKWSSFGWAVFEVDGHNIKEIINCFNQIKKTEKPSLIVAKTIKGKGVSFMEDNNDWHHNRLTEKLFHEAMNEM